MPNEQIKKVLDALCDCMQLDVEFGRAEFALRGNRRKFSDDEKKVLKICDTARSLRSSTEEILNTMIETYFPDYFAM